MAIKKEEMYKGGKAVLSDRQREKIEKAIDGFLNSRGKENSYKKKETFGNKEEIMRRIAADEDLSPEAVERYTANYIRRTAERGSRFKTKDGKMSYKAGYTKKGDSKKAMGKQAMALQKKLGLVKDGKKNSSPTQMDKDKASKKSRGGLMRKPKLAQRGF